MSGQERIMAIQPSDINQRFEVILGAKKEAEKCLSQFK